MEEECVTCMQTFHPIYRVPVIVCEQFHACCQICMYEQIRNTSDRRCPTCRLPLLIKKERTVFQGYMQAEQQLVDWKSNQQEEVVDLKMGIISTIIQLSVWEFNRKVKGMFRMMRQIATALLRQKEYQCAAELIKRLIETHFEYAESERFFGLGSLLEARGYNETADYEWYERRFGAQISLYDQLALCEMMDDHYEETVEWYRSMRVDAPRSYQLAFGLAVLELNAGRRPTEAFKKVISLRKSFSKPYLMIAMFDEELRGEYARKCLNLDPANVQAQFYYCLACHQENLEEKMSEILKRHPDYAYPLQTIVFTYYHKGQTEKAIQFFRKSIEIDPGFFSTRWILAKLGVDSDFLAEVIADGQSSRIEKVEACMDLGSIYYKHHEYFDSAEHCYLSALSFDPSYCEAARRLLQLYMNLGRYEMTIDHCLRALKAGSQCVQLECGRSIYFYYLAAAYIRLKDYELAVKTLKDWQGEEQFSSISQQSFDFHQSEDYRTILSDLEAMNKWNQECDKQRFSWSLPINRKSIYDCFYL